MELVELKNLNLPESPGVYTFRGKDGKILYIGKATSLRDRVRSYFSATVATRGVHIEEMVRVAETVTFEPTDSVLEALILEAARIKSFQPPYNSKEKDNKSFNYVVVTEEEYPRVFTIRERTLLAEGKGGYRFAWGPFPHGSSLLIALEILRKIIPYRDKCIPGAGKPCFYRQIGLCPGVCDGSISVSDYRASIRHIQLFFEGKKSVLKREITKSMKHAASELRFEDAQTLKRQLFSLDHIEDVQLIGADIREESALAATPSFRRIEGFDVAHLAGENMVGVMVVVEGGVAQTASYRTFNIRKYRHANDPGALREMLERRFLHTEWGIPDIIVVDGNNIQKNVAEDVVLQFGFSIQVIAVTKDERHKPKDIMGDESIIHRLRPSILLANAEAHRFSLKTHRKKRDKIARK